MIALATIIGTDVSRDWRGVFCLPGGQRFRFADTAEGHLNLIKAIQCLRVLVLRLGLPVHSPPVPR